MLLIELSYRVPERFISLTLCVTTAGGFPLCNVPPVRPPGLLQAIILSHSVNSGLDLKIC